MSSFRTAAATAAPTIAVHPWERGMRPTRRELLTSDHVDPAIERHMTLPTRTSLVPSIDTLSPASFGQATDQQDDEEEEDDDDDAFHDYEDDSSDVGDLDGAFRSTSFRNTSMHGRLHRPNPAECKETESFDGHQVDCESVASQQLQREIYHHRDALSVSTDQASHYDITSLKASDSVMEQQMNILRQIQDENERKGQSDEGSIRRRESSGSKRPRESINDSCLYEPPQRRMSRHECDASVPLSSGAVIPPPPLKAGATAKLAMFLQGRHVQNISKARVEEATKKGTAIKVICVGCGNKLWAARDMAMVYCPRCGTLAPLDLAVIATK